MEIKKTSEVGIKALEKTGDPFILTRKRATGYFSFANPKSHEFDYNRPPPIYLKMEYLNEEKDYNKETTFADFKKEKNGELKLINEDIKERQRGVVKDVFANAATKLLEGKNVIGLSLPVRIFESRSQMERLIDNYQGFPVCMERAVKEKEPVERIKHIIAAVIGKIHHSMSQYKPFNPILGETFKGTYGKDTIIYTEHVSHHPPISAYHIIGKGWTLHGMWGINGEIGPVRIKPYNEGWGYLEFEDGDKYKIMMPSATLKGMIVGSRTLRMSGSLVVVNEASEIKGVVRMGEPKKSKGFFKKMMSKDQADAFHGKIYKYKVDQHNDTVKKEVWLDIMAKLGKMEDVEKEICEISGSWMQSMLIDEKVFWDIDENKDDYDQQMFCDDPLPSDVRFREDITWLNYGNLSYAQEWKTTLEEQQRKDRRSRNKK